MDRNLPTVPSGVRDRIFVHSLAWVASARWMSQLLRWVATIAMAKLLVPGDYGIVGMAAVLVGLINQVAEFGLGAAVVQHREISRRTEQRLAGVAVLVAIALAVITSALAPLAARFYSQEALLLVVPAMSMRFIFDSFGTIPRGILARELRFKEIALMEAVESIVMAVVGIAVAFAMQSYWALVAANLAGGAALAVAANVRAARAPHWPGALSELRPLLNFGRDLVVSRLAWFSYSNADFVIIGRVLGTEALGVYTLAWNIASAPMEKFAGMVLSVAPAILSDAREQAGEVRRLFLGMVQGVSLVVFPLAVGLAVVSEPLVLGLLGSRWAAAVVPLRLLALALIFRALASLEPVVLMSRRETYIDRNMMVLFAIVAPVLFFIGSRWGMTGVAATWLIAMPLLSLPLQRHYIWRSIDVGWRDWGCAVWPAASSAAVMAAVSVGIGAVRTFESVTATMAAQVIAGALTYPAALWLAHRPAAEALVRVINTRRSPIVAEHPVLRTDPV